MKSARRRACDAAEMLGLVPSQRHYLSMLDALESLFQEHAQDQRQNCGEAVKALAVGYDSGDATNVTFATNRAHGLVVNAPAPGEQR
jgi:hypothetical protein